MHEAVAFLVEHLPPHVHLVIATREELPLSRLRVRGELAEVRTEDLRFTPPEAAKLFTCVLRREIFSEEVAAVENRTEGWIDGLQLFAISMQDREEAADLIRSFSGSTAYVWDYLGDEVLRQQPEAVQEFLVKTSVPDRLCGPLCDAVIGEDGPPGQETLEYLQRGNSFVVCLDDERRWYRYHHLFRDFLQRRLRASCRQSREGTAVLHERAAAWYEAMGIPVEAFRHATASGNVDAAARLIEAGGARGVLEWLETVSRETLDERPMLWVSFASARFGPEWLQAVMRSTR